MDGRNYIPHAQEIKNSFHKAFALLFNRFIPRNKFHYPLSAYRVYRLNNGIIGCIKGPHYWKFPVITANAQPLKEEDICLVNPPQYIRDPSDTSTHILPIYIRHISGIRICMPYISELLGTNIRIQGRYIYMG